MLFRTDRSDQTINNTSSYLDLSILYGINQAQQDAVRDKESGRGYLYPDSFAEDRLVLVPAASTALLVILSRNHNVRVYQLGASIAFIESLTNRRRVICAVSRAVHLRLLAEHQRARTLGGPVQAQPYAARAAG